MSEAFHGAKGAVFIGQDLLVYCRDAHVIWPNMWDFPGGGREGNESPQACLMREVHEEFGLTLQDADILWGIPVPSMMDRSMLSWFFAVALHRDAKSEIRFGSEGTNWELMPPEDVLNLQNIVPHLQDRLRLWLQHSGRDLI